MTTTAPNKQCGECGQECGLEPFSGRAFTLASRTGLTTTLADLAGWQCHACDEVVFDAASAAQYAAAGDAMVLQERTTAAENLKRVRTKLGLTQQAAAELTGGGHNAFSRYENGLAAPVAAVTNLFTLLDHHPELLREIRSQKQREHAPG